MLILKIVYWLVVVILALKVVSNLLIPVTLSKKLVMNEKTGETGGVSLVPIVDVFCFSILLVLAFFINDGFLYRVGMTALIFGGSIGISFVIAFVATGFIGWKRSQ